MARAEKFDTDEDYETGGVGDRYSKPGEMKYIDQLSDPDIMKIYKSWGVPDPRTLAPDPPSEAEPPRDPDEETVVAGDMPTDKEGYDEWRRGRTMAQASTDDVKYGFMVKQYERRPEWKQFLEELGDQAKTFSARELLLVYQAWNDARSNDKPAWLNEEEAGPSDLQDLNEKFTPDDRNDAMGPAPKGNFKIPTRISNGGSG